MRKIAAALIVMLMAIALHAVAMGVWHDGHAAPFHAGQALLTCPMGYVCPVSPEVLKMAFVSPSPKVLVDLAPLLLAVAAVVYASAVDRWRYRPASQERPNSPEGLLSIFKKE
jgi:hypothetical protein